jgi:indolepyruvate ferredoxin oxidoreductase
MQRLQGTFEGDYALKFHLAPPIFAKPDPVTGVPRKRAFGPWMMSAFRVLARLKGLRGTAFDVFGRTEERRTERQLIADYERTVEELLGRLDRDNHAAAVAIAGVPDEIRGFGHVKAASLKQAKGKQAELLAAFRSPTPSARAA